MRKCPLMEVRDDRIWRQSGVGECFDCPSVGRYMEVVGVNRQQVLGAIAPRIVASRVFDSQPSNLFPANIAQAVWTRPYWTPGASRPRSVATRERSSLVPSSV